MDTLKALLRHKGKLTLSTLLGAGLLLAIGRGCRVEMQFDPVHAREETNSPALTE